MGKTISGWQRVAHNGRIGYKSGDLAHYKEKITYGDGVVVDCILSEFGPGIAEGEGATANVPNPPAGVDWLVMFIQNNTMSVGGDIVLQGAEKSGGTFATLKDDLIAYDASTSGGTSKASTYTQQPGLTPTGGRMPVMRFYQDDDGLHSSSTGTEKTAEVHLMWVIP